MRGIAAGLIAAAALALQCAWAQQLPVMGTEIRGRVVDEAGAPVQGAIVVARWNWLEYHARLEGSGYYFGGDAIHIDEAVSGRDGRYVIPGWGPKVRPTGRLEQGAPAILAFKPGFEPSVGREANIRLGAAPAGSPGYAQRVRKFQESSLIWQYPNDNWQRMPRMVNALFREKVRLGEGGREILGPNMIPGRSGAGRIVDSQTGQGVTQAVVAIVWTLMRTDGRPGERRYVQTRRAGTDQHGVEFYVSPWRLPGPNVPGWEINPAVEPDLVIYAAGYRAESAERWPEAGGTIKIRRLPEGREATLGNLRAWRRDIDREIAQGDRTAALEGERVLLQDFAYQCRSLTPDLQKGLCFDAQSDVGQYIERSRAIASSPIETLEGTSEMRIVAVNRGSAMAAHAMAPSGFYIQREPVKGFSIEVAK